MTLSEEIDAFIADELAAHRERLRESAIAATGMDFEDDGEGVLTGADGMLREYGTGHDDQEPWVGSVIERYQGEV